MNVAHYYRKTPRHHWRLSSVTVNAAESLPAVRTITGYPGLYADVPYDWEVWLPPNRTRALPGITRAMLAYFDA